MELLTQIERPLRRYFDLEFEVDFEDDGVVTETDDSITVTYRNGLSQEASFARIEGSLVTLNTITTRAPNGVILWRTGPFDLRIDLEQAGEPPLRDFDSFRFEFSDARDADMFAPDFSIEASRTVDGTFTTVSLGGGFPQSADLEFDFGGGEDTATFDLSRDMIDIRQTANGIRVTTSEDRARFFNIEEIALNDGTLLFDESGEFAAYTYALYAASLTRTPDEAGFRFWNGVMNSGDFDGPTREHTELRLAETFVTAPEFTERFDVSSDDAYIDALYINVLGRGADQAGKDFWLDVFASPDQGREDLLRFFAGSEENLARIAPDVEGGFWVI